jgi:hypothetical protein
MHGKLKIALVLFAEVGGLLAVFLIFLFVLGYFKIITLPNLYLKTATTTPINSAVVNNNQNSAPVSFAKLTNQASDNQIVKYQTYAAGLSKPQIQTNPNDYASDAIFSGYNNRTIQVVTSEGVLNLSFDQNTLFQKYPKPVNQTGSSQSSGMLFKPIKYSSSYVFFGKVVFGSTLQIEFSKPNLKAIQVNYVESIQPVL